MNQAPQILGRSKALTKADACISCGHCNSRCPFHVDQMARMKQINAYFTEKRGE